MSLNDHVEETLAQVGPDEAPQWIAEQLGVPESEVREVLDLCKQGADAGAQVFGLKPSEIAEEQWLVGAITATLASQQVSAE